MLLLIDNYDSFTYNLVQYFAQLGEEVRVYRNDKITVEQVDNMALAVMQRRQLDVAEQAELDRAMDRAWANLPPNYQWLKDWEYV